MSLRDFALKALDQAKTSDSLTVPLGQPLGVSQWDTKGGQIRTSKLYETNGTLGTLGTPGTDGTAGTPTNNLDPEAMLACEYGERAAILEYEAGLPREWAEFFARQLVNCPPGDFSPVRWQVAIDGALSFADQWACEAHRLGWSVLDVFGLHPTVPAARYDCRGLAWMLGDQTRVTSIDESGADIETALGGRQRFYRAKEPPEKKRYLAAGSGRTL